MTQDIHSLTQKHRHRIDGLREFVHSQCPDLKRPTPTLTDGTLVDDLFYLRYVLSAKDLASLDSPAAIPDSDSAKHLLSALAFRSAKCPAILAQKENAALRKKIPICRTGELINGDPVVVLPINSIDFDYLGSDECDQDEVFNHFLRHKFELFTELEEKTRRTGRMAKTLVVYDLNGMSFRSIYKLTRFFKLTQQHSKVFKAVFPQSTSCTLIVNSPGQFVVKMFASSKKQRMVSLEEMFMEYSQLSIKQALPTFLGGSAAWPLDAKRAKVAAKQIQPQPAAVVRPAVEKPVEIKRTMADHTERVLREMQPQTGGDPRAAMKTNLTDLEQNFVLMKKNRIFSVDVLQPNQQLRLTFNNYRNKSCNVLLAVKEKNTQKNSLDLPLFSVSNSSTILQPGFNHINLNIKNPSEVIMVYVSRSKVGENNLHNIETMRFRKKKVKKMARKVRKLLVNYNSKGQPIDEAVMLKEDVDKVFFRFEVSESILPGSLGGDIDIGDVQSAKTEQGSKMTWRRNADGLVDYDEDGLITMSSKAASEKGWFASLLWG